MRSGGTKNIPWSASELDWVEAHRRLMRRDSHAMFCAKFRPIKLGAYTALCKRKGWMTGRDGRIQKGNVPANKGKKMPFNANSARTQFKKGGRTGRANQVYKPVGTERITVDGYIERKIHEGLPMQSRWRAVHLLNWEAKHGPIPKGQCLKCKSGDKGNTDPSNWELIPRGALPFLNGHRGHNYDQASPELRPTILALARLRHAKGVKATRKKTGKHAGA
jgi:HNH endonuclease